MIYSINHFISKLFELILTPFSKLPDMWGILFLSIISSFIVLFAFKFASSPEKIKQAKNQIKANILAIRLYKDSWQITISSFFKSLFFIGRYFSLNMVTLLLVIPFLFPFLPQMEGRYGIQPFKIGDEIIVKMKFSESFENLKIKMIETPNYKLLIPPVHVHALKEINWKLAAEKEGLTEIQIAVDQHSIKKNIAIGHFSVPLSEYKYNNSQWGHFLYPLETMMALNYPVLSVSISYPTKLINVFGLSAHWLVYYFIFMLIIVLALKNYFKIEF
jgi:hypothetical protein